VINFKAITFFLSASFSTSLIKAAALVALLCLSFGAFAEKTSVWKVSSKNSNLYLGGTVHLLQPSDHPLPEQFDTAYGEASKIYLETNLEESNTPEFQALMMKALMLQDGSTLSSKLKEPVKNALATFLSERGMNIALFETFKPSGMSLTLSVIEMQRMGMQPELGVDKTYEDKAKKDNKALGALETVEEQLSFIQSMDQADPNKLMEYTLRDLKDLNGMMENMKAAWRQGDMTALGNPILGEMKSEFPVVYATLIKNRNDAWIEKIKPMLETEETEFILVGALHLAGEDGLLTALDSLGYKIEQL